MAMATPTLLQMEYEDHAAHDPWTRKPLHDLEFWHVLDNPRLGGRPVRPSCVPVDAEFHSGYDSDRGPVTLWYRRRRPRKASCPLCEARARFGGAA